MGGVSSQNKNGVFPVWNKALIAEMAESAIAGYRSFGDHKFIGRGIVPFAEPGRIAGKAARFVLVAGIDLIVAHGKILSDKRNGLPFGAVKLKIILNCKHRKQSHEDQ